MGSLCRLAGRMRSGGFLGYVIFSLMGLIRDPIWGFPIVRGTLLGSLYYNKDYSIRVYIRVPFFWETTILIGVRTGALVAAFGSIARPPPRPCCSILA